MAKKYIRRTHKKHRKTACKRSTNKQSTSKRSTSKRTIRRGGACPCSAKIF